MGLSDLDLNRLAAKVFCLDGGDLFYYDQELTFLFRLACFDTAASFLPFASGAPDTFYVKKGQTTTPKLGNQGLHQSCDVPYQS